MRFPTLLCGALVLAMMSLKFPAPSQRRQCLCLPTHWEGKMQNQRNTLHVKTGQWRVSKNLWTVHFDYRRQQIAAMLDASSKYQIVADSSKGVMYMLTELGCRAICSGVKIERTCKP
ncbi:hypothetical protein LSAT2_000820, partial [Lamellibrachia satsuma]